MPIDHRVRYSPVDDLYLDPMNPRLGRHDMDRGTPEDRLLELMNSWVLDELAWSYLESGGFWAHEAVIAVREELYGQEVLVVVEGNRRVAAVKMLQRAVTGQPASKKWGRIIEGRLIPDELFREVPYLLADTRADVDSFLGFRHVTGIKQWKAEEKAEFIAKLIDSSEDTFKQVARKIGSKAPAVRRHYVAYKLLLEMEDSVDDFDPELVDSRFTPLYMSLDTAGAQDFLEISLEGVPERCVKLITDLDRLKQFYRWLFVPINGQKPLIANTGQVSDFGKILRSEEAIQYLQSAKNPDFAIALQLAEDPEEEIIEHLRGASYEIRRVLSSIHTLKKSEPIQGAVRQLGIDAMQLLSIFPAIHRELREDD